MGREYGHMRTEELVGLRDGLRERVKAGHGERGDMDELWLICRELDRRRGVENPRIYVNFDKYVTK